MLLKLFARRIMAKEGVEADVDVDVDVDVSAGEADVEDEGVGAGAEAGAAMTELWRCVVDVESESKVRERVSECK